MRANLLPPTLFLALMAATPASAQDVQEQIDPTQLEERDEEDRETPDDVTEIESAQSVIVEADAREYDVGAIIVTGNRALPKTAFIDIVEAYGARTLTRGDIAALAESVAQRAREQGYILAVATVEPQSLAGGVLRINLDEGTVDELRISGVDEAAISGQLSPLLNGEPVTMAELERAVLIAGDVSGVYIRSTRFEREEGKGVLYVDASRDTIAGSVELENDGSEPVGPLRARIDADFNGLLTATDEVDVTFSTTPLQPGELQYASASYAAMVTPGGLELSVTGSYSNTEPGSFLADRQIVGESVRGEARARYPLHRSRDTSTWLEGEFELRELRQDRRGELSRRDRLAVLRLGLFGLQDMAGGRLRGRLTVSQGLDIMGATKPGDPLASRRDASGVFTLGEAWVDWKGPLFGNVSMALGARGQVSSDPLLITEDLGLGGPRFLRAYSYNERSGDEGVMGYGELRYDWDDPLGVARRMQLYTFADGGVVNDLGDVRSEGSLFSTGGGMRLDITRDLDLDVEMAVPLSGIRFDSGDETPRFNLRLKHDF